MSNGNNFSLKQTIKPVYEVRDPLISASGDFQPLTFGKPSTDIQGLTWVREAIVDQFGSPYSLMTVDIFLDEPITASFPDVTAVESSILWGYDANLNEFYRARMETDNADGLTTTVSGHLATINHNTIFNGATWDRVRSFAASIASLFSGQYATLVNGPGQFSITHAPAVNTQATITRAAAGAGIRNICKSISARLIIPAGGTAGGGLVVVLRDGASGAGPILWSETIGSGTAVIDETSHDIKISGLDIVGSANTAMTLEFSAAGGVGTFESVALTGITTQ